MGTAGIPRLTTDRTSIHGTALIMATMIPTPALGITRTIIRMVGQHRIATTRAILMVMDTVAPTIIGTDLIVAADMDRLGDRR